MDTDEALKMPSYNEMVTVILVDPPSSYKRKGLTRSKIQSLLLKKYEIFLADRNRKIVNRNLRRSMLLLINKGDIVATEEGFKPSNRFKLSENVKKKMLKDEKAKLKNPKKAKIAEKKKKNPEIKKKSEKNSSSETENKSSNKKKTQMKKKEYSDKAKTSKAADKQPKVAAKKSDSKKMASRKTPSKKSPLKAPPNSPIKKAKNAKSRVAGKVKNKTKKVSKKE